MSSLTPRRPSAAQPKASPPLEPTQDVFILYPRLKELHQEIRRCCRLSRMAGEPHCMALEGLTGAGKSTLMRQYAAGFPRQETREGTRIPVFYLETPSPATVKTMASAMLESLGDPAAHVGTIGPLNSRLIKLLKACEVELVILDDFQHLIDTETDRVLAKVSDWLKVLIKETGIPFLVVGMEGKVERILHANAQLSRLFAARECLAPFCWQPDRPETIQTFHVFVNTAETSLGRPLTAEVPRTELLYRLYYSTGGVVGNLMNLLRYAVTLAEEQSQAQVTLPLLAGAFEHRLAKHMCGLSNPFGVPADEKFLPPR